MAFTLEDGSGVEGANAYVSETELDNYADDRSVILASGDAEAAIIRATTFIDAKYRSRFSGSRTNGRSQGLEWPRSDATDGAENDIADDEIPSEVKSAVCEAAIRELVEPNSLMPDLDRGGQIKRLKAGSVEIEYGANASAETTFTIIDGILAGLLGSSNGLTARAVRG